jgi:S-adenosylmethionine hydrolase
VAARAGGSVFVLTDYGLADEFAGVLRAVVLRDAPGASVIDLTHGVTPFDVRAGALALARAAPHLGPGVVLAVVDPAVGTRRRAVALSVSPAEDDDRPRHFVGPDNGLLPWAVDLLGGVDRAVELHPCPGDETSSTFDGRDLFAPVAARLWRGVPLTDLGDDLDPRTLVRLPAPRLAVSPGALEAEVLWVDRFGNVQLAARPDDAAGASIGPELAVDAAAVHRARRVATFAELEPGGLGLVVDANGHLCLVCNRQSAATVLKVQPGDVVTVRAAAPGPGSS